MCGGWIPLQFCYDTLHAHDIRRVGFLSIGYDGLGYVTDEVKVIGIAPHPGEEYIFPAVETVNSGLYPIARDLYMYTNGQPEGKVAEYMDWIFSAEAQEIVADLGFVPIITDAINE